ncbi:hypothetical protein CLV84_2224 [Neolewinella xylanilytica]|uniref:Sulfotransferase family protein n=1 Tax=Neolewinella xylanilytica TaxID=1514080 RepID=A0A2S6I2M6_9BACT|nr:hypothetical protein [Neolewinella xylanilytica]PPK85329.1 hypothetical protein CLV84_2224 [Neolewinella xylanilytica]
MKYLVAGEKRTGTTLLCAILAKAGAEFGFPHDREWFRGSGDYEHPIMIENYKYLKRARLAKFVSDTMAARLQRKIQSNMKELLAEVDYIKYPPLSHSLPIHMKLAGHEVRLVITIRKFNTFAMSAVAKNGECFKELKEAYIDTYKTNLLNLYLYGGCAVLYEDIVDREKTDWAVRVSQITGVSADKLLQARDTLMNPTVSRNAINEATIDRECDELYATFAQLSERVFEADLNKQHTVKL